MQRSGREGSFDDSNAAPGQADAGAHGLVEAGVGGVTRTALFRRTSSCPQCSGGYEYDAAQQVDDAVSVLVVGHGEDGDPGFAIARPFAAMAAEKLQTVAPGTDHPIQRLHRGHARVVDAGAGSRGTRLTPHEGPGRTGEGPRTASD